MLTTTAIDAAKLPTGLLPVKFSHQQHLKIVKTCETCHQGLAQSDAVTAANMPHMPGCLTCHTKIDPPFSCETCHTADQKLKPASHTADFIDTHARKVAKIDKSGCAVCHGRRFTCMGCH